MDKHSRIVALTSGLVLGCAGLVLAAGVVELARFDETAPSAAAYPDDVTVVVDTSERGWGESALKITYAGKKPTSVTLYETPLKNVENGVLVGSAMMRSEAVANKAYLEMDCRFEGTNAGEFFSRGLDQSFSGTQPWREVRTPFLLQPGDRPVGVKLGVRFEGPGTVWVDNAALAKADSAAAGLSGGYAAWAWLPGTALGVIMGLWGGLAGTLASFGKGRRFVLSSGITLLVLDVVLCAAGVLLLVLGRPYGLWFGALLPGGIGVAVMCPLLPIVRGRYEQVETARMKAMDLGRSIE